MIATIVISILTCALLISSILFFPKLKIKNIEINTYWIVCSIGDFFILLFNFIYINEVVDGLFSNSINNLA